ncbi:tyrosine-type recombinase/integrase [Amycolatopsis sp.]|uniref:tyrosine-type recombinase/integrase n=1 Tax=Amycolatopsis sp. TaxID=37632 RepID=UPI002E0202FB|nr:tyrosine-type recombinase/integrase [Amycolatopsis sp.]
MADPIKKVTLKSGAVRYRFVVDIGADPVTGKRQQKTYTYDLKREAIAERSRILSETAQGTYIRPSKQTLNEHLDEWLPPVVRDLAENTKSSYVGAFRLVRERLGHKELQKLTKNDIEQLVTFMLTSGRKRGGPVGSGLSGRSVALTLGRLTAALESAQLEGKIPRNVAKLVKPPAHTKKPQGTWSKAEVRKFLGTAGKERLHAAWRMSLYGLRRGEVLGLRWAEDVDLDGKTITINETRVLVEYRVIVKPPKSDNGLRTLPLDDEMVSALRALRARQAAEKLAAGPAYVDSGYVVADELGEPVHPENYSDEFERVLKRAGVPRIVLHGARHTAISLMEKSGVPISIISKWAGHFDVKFTYGAYVHAEAEDLHEGTAALGKLYKIN